MVGTGDEQRNMKGIIIAGGLGTRLRPLTKTINKQLLPVYNKPLIYYPLELLLKMGITSILIISGTEHSGQFLNQLGSGEEFGATFSYAVQNAPQGIAHALSLARTFADNEKIAVILGDNIFEDEQLIVDAAKRFETQEHGAKIFVKAVPDPERFGVVSIDGDKITGIEEKPKDPKTNLAVVGLYMYDDRVFEIIDALAPSARGEYEITDVNKAYINAGTMSYEILKGEWIDAGTFDSLLRAGNFIAEKTRKELDAKIK